MNKITINGTVITGDLSGGVSIRNGEVRVGGKLVQANVSGDVHVKWDGPLTSLETDGSATVSGEVRGSVSAGGSVTCGPVGESINAGGSVKCDKVGGGINAGGNVTVR